jgi:hypothetical protein
MLAASPEDFSRAGLYVANSNLVIEDPLELRTVELVSCAPEIIELITRREGRGEGEEECGSAEGAGARHEGTRYGGARYGGGAGTLESEYHPLPAQNPSNEVEGGNGGRVRFGPSTVYLVNKDPIEGRNGNDTSTHDNPPRRASDERRNRYSSEALAAQALAAEASAAQDLDAQASTAQDPAQTGVFTGLLSAARVLFGL